MKIDKKHLASAPQRVGSVDGRAVHAIATRGGLHLVVVAKGQGFETLGAGPHKAVARHIAKKKAPGIIWTDLEKSEACPEEAFAFCLPKYEALTDALRSAQE